MKLFRRLLGGGAQNRTVRTPPGRRIYAIGDIHGRDDLLAELYRRVADDAARHPGRTPVLVHLGDYIDRGPDSAAVLDRIAAPPAPHIEPVALKGNHEAMLEGFLADSAEGPAWLAAGGLETVMSYGVTLPRLPRSPAEFQDLRDRLAAAIPAGHLRRIATMKLLHREGGYLFVHAGIRPGISLDAQSADDLMWIRGEFLNSRADHGCVVVHGHSIRFEIESKPNRIGIDTGAYATGRLTCLVLDGEERLMLHTG